MYLICVSLALAWLLLAKLLTDLMVGDQFPSLTAASSYMAVVMASLAAVSYLIAHLVMTP